MTARVLAVTSSASDGAALAPILAAIELEGAELRALDLGKVGSSSAVDRVWRAVAGESGERRLHNELAQRPPAVAVGFDAASVRILCDARDQGCRMVVAAVVSELRPSERWSSTDADRYFPIDDDAAVALADAGVPGSRVVPVGPFCEIGFARAGAQSRDALRRRFKLPATSPVILCEVAGLDSELVSQLTLQLSLLASKAVFLFDSGRDSDAATVLRHQVPALDMKAKLFGVTSDAPLLWRCADAVIGRASARTVSRVLALGAKLVALSPEGAAQERTQALEDRGVARAAKNALLVSASLEALLGTGGSGACAGRDGAASVARALVVVARDADSIAGERDRIESEKRSARVEEVARAASKAASRAAPAGDLEDLGSDGGEPFAAAPDLGELSQLRAELRVKKERAERTISEAHKAAESWARRRAAAAKKGDRELAERAGRQEELERARMHSALTEMASISEEEKTLETAHKQAASAPRDVPPPPRERSRAGARPPRKSVDDELADLKRRAQTPSASAAGASGAGKKPKSASNPVEDELEALKRKMKSGKRKR